MTSVAAFVLVGGKSSRMGREKSQLLLHGSTLLDRAIEIARTASNNVFLLGTPPISTSLPCIDDRFPGCGPLSGIDAALAATTAERNFILSVDTPFVPAEFVKYLLRRAEESNAVVTYARPASGYQPLCAVYRREFGPVAEQALRAGKYKIDPLYARVSTCMIDDAALRELGFSDEIFDNLNTQEDWQRAEQRLSPR